MKTFFKTYKDGFESIVLSESNSSLYKYDISADKNSALILINDNKIDIDYNTGLNVYFILNNKLDFYRYYTNIDSNLITIENILKDYNEHIIIFIQNTPLTIKQRELYSKYSLTKYTNNLTDISVYNSNIKKFTHSMAKVDPKIMFVIDTINDLGSLGYDTILYETNYDKNFKFEYTDYINVKVVLDTGYFTINNKQYNTNIDLDIKGSIDIKVYGNLKSIIITKVIVNEKLNNAKIGLNGVNNTRLIEGYNDNILSLTDKNSNTKGQWYTKKENGKWILENDEKGNPIHNYFVFDGSVVDNADRNIVANNLSEITDIKLNFKGDSYINNELIEYTRPYYEYIKYKYIKFGELHINKNRVKLINTNNEHEYGVYDYYFGINTKPIDLDKEINGLYVKNINNKRVETVPNIEHFAISGNGKIYKDLDTMTIYFKEE